MKNIILCLLVIFTSACAFTDAKLKVSHDPSGDIEGPISEAPKINFSAPKLEDARQDKIRIGWKKNGFGANTADITTEKPVEKIVEEALIDAVNDNGHNISDSPDVRVTGTVDRFWFDFDPNFWTVEFMGDVQCTLTFTDATTNDTIYESQYSGSYKKKTGGGLEKTWTEVMNGALKKLIEDIVFDEDLAEALEEYKN